MILFLRRTLERYSCIQASIVLPSYVCILVFIRPPKHPLSGWVAGGSRNPSLCFQFRKSNNGAPRYQRIPAEPISSGSRMQLAANLPSVSHARGVTSPCFSPPPHWRLISTQRLLENFPVARQLGRHDHSSKLYPAGFRGNYHLRSESELQ